MIVLSDANIFIDLYDIGLLEYFVEVDFEVATTDLVYSELYQNQKDAIGKLNIKILSFENNLDELMESFSTRSTLSLSIQDFSLYFVAKKYGYYLMSNDKKLRNYAKSHNVDVVGVFYIFDKLREYKVIGDSELYAKLLALKEHNNRLEKLVDQWIGDNL